MLIIGHSSTERYDSVAVAYLVECAHHIAREITSEFRDRGVHLIGFGGCFGQLRRAESFSVAEQKKR